MIKNYKEIMKGEKMRQQKIIFLLLVVSIALILVLSSKIGYASATNNSFKIHDNVEIRPEHSDFNVGFSKNTTYTGTGKANIRIIGRTKAVMDITGLSSVGDYVTATFNIENRSYDISAKLSKSVSNSNNEYFKVTATLSNNTIQPRRGEATLNIKVELIKSPIAKAEQTNICVSVIAEPIQHR